MDKIEVRHETLKGESVFTMYGEVKLDQDGYVSNLGELTGSGQQLVKDVPHFVDATVFPLPRENTAIELSEDEVYLEAIKEFLDLGGDLNTDGYAEMEDLNKFLSEKGLKAISGTRRKELTDAAGLRNEPE